METNFDTESAKEAYAEKETEDLINIAFLDNEEFLPEAINIARVELNSRGITSPDHELVLKARDEFGKQTEEDEKLSNEKLHAGWKMYCFLIGDLIAIIVAMVKWANGKKRASRDAVKMIAIGWLVKVTIGTYLLWQ